MVRILVLSDAPRWTGKAALVDEVQPDIVLLPGDLTYDGTLDATHILWTIPEFAASMERLGREHKVAFHQGRVKSIGRAPATFLRKAERLGNHWMGRSEYEAAYRTTHVAAFYHFLRHAGKQAKVLVTDGNHDHLPYYDPSKINAIPGCREISGKKVQVKGLEIVGMGWEQGRIKTNIRTFFDEISGPVPPDLVLCHAPQQMVPVIASTFKPRLLVRGHYGFGSYYAADVPSLFSQGVSHSVVELAKVGEPELRQYVRRAGILGEVTHGNCLPKNLASIQKLGYVSPPTWTWLRPYRSAP